MSVGGTRDSNDAQPVGTFARGARFVEERTCRERPSMVRFESGNAVAVGRDRETSKQDDRARERRGRHACHRKCGFAVRRSRAKRRC